jgi:hypothetical protein
LKELNKEENFYNLLSALSFGSSPLLLLFALSSLKELNKGENFYNLLSALSFAPLLLLLFAFSLSFFQFPGIEKHLSRSTKWTRCGS